MVNQMECNPYLAIAPLREYCARNGIVVEAWFPLGGPAGEGLGPKPETDRIPLLQNETIVDVAKTRGWSPAQVVLRWELAVWCDPPTPSPSARSASARTTQLSILS